MKEYYESVGKNNPLSIYCRPGSYVPMFRNQRGRVNFTATEAAPRDSLTGGDVIRIAVLPFLDASGTASSGICAQLITDDLIHELVRTDGIRVTAASSVAPLVAKAMGIRSLARKLDVQIVLEGTVRHDNNLLRITSRVVDPADGFQIWSERIQTEPDLQDLFKVSERIASSLVSRIRPTNGFNERQHSLHHVRLILNSPAESGLLTHTCDRIQQSEYQAKGPNPDRRVSFVKTGPGGAWTTGKPGKFGELQQTG
ncbi:hypothetical protein [Tunturiibacter gelidiferens]|uniref:hypothetical protein n=1 Tax=Tunturiibacter gelidiferens TaxID=3069689 RepID=UPI003D9AFEF9